MVELSDHDEAFKAELDTLMDKYGMAAVVYQKNAKISAELIDTPNSFIAQPGFISKAV